MLGISSTFPQPFPASSSLPLLAERRLSRRKVDFLATFTGSSFWKPKSTFLQNFPSTLFNTWRLSGNLWEAPSLSANSERRSQRIEVLAGVYIVDCRTFCVQWNVLWLLHELLLLESDKRPHKAIFDNTVVNPRLYGIRT